MPMNMTPELYQTITAIVDQRVAEIKVTRQDFSRLQEALEKLVEAQARAEERVVRLEGVVEKLAEAQVRTEVRVGRLEEAIEKLAEAQARTEVRVGRLEEAIEKLAEAQAKTETAVKELAQAQTRFERTFQTQMGALGARWGLSAEQSFREGMRAILEDVGFKTERYLVYDETGKVFDHPDQVELDVVVHDGKVMLVEIKSSASRADVAAFQRKVRFYEEREDKKADRRILISPFVDERARTLGLAMGIEIYPGADELVAS